jgi:pimeloyl-ACP methyl ester carboxylesterase
MPQSEKGFDTGELLLNYVEDSLSGPPLLLIHGFSGRLQSWEPLIPYLTPPWHVVRYDLRGHGKSGRVAGEYHLLDYARDAIALSQALFTEPAVLMGHSLGAMIAVAVAAQVPERVRGTVLLDPPFCLHDSPVSAMASAYNWFLSLYATLKTEPPYEELIAACRALSPDADPAFIKAQADNVCCLDIGAPEIARHDQILAGWDWQLLQRVICPVLLMRGDWDHDAVMRDEDAVYAKAHIAHLVDVKMPNGTHGFPWEQMDATMRHVRAFLQSV